MLRRFYTHSHKFVLNSGDQTGTQLYFFILETSVVDSSTFLKLTLNLLAPTKVGAHINP